MGSSLLFGRWACLCPQCFARRLACHGPTPFFSQKTRCGLVLLTVVFTAVLCMPLVIRMPAIALVTKQVFLFSFCFVYPQHSLLILLHVDNMLSLPSKMGSHLSSCYAFCCFRVCLALESPDASQVASQR